MLTVRRDGRRDILNLVEWGFFVGRGSWTADSEYWIADIFCFVFIMSNSSFQAYSRAER